MGESSFYLEQIKSKIAEAQKQESREEAERKRRKIKATEATERKWSRQQHENYQNALKQGYAKRNRQQSKRKEQHPTWSGYRSR